MPWSLRKLKQIRFAYGGTQQYPTVQKLCNLVITALVIKLGTILHMIMKAIKLDGREAATRRERRLQVVISWISLEIISWISLEIITWISIEIISRTSTELFQKYHGSISLSNKSRSVSDVCESLSQCLSTDGPSVMLLRLY